MFKTKKTKVKKVVIALGTGDYNALVEANTANDRVIANLQRERDLKVDAINKEYDAKLDIYIRRKEEFKIAIRDTKEYVAKN